MRTAKDPAAGRVGAAVILDPYKADRRRARWIMALGVVAWVAAIGFMGWLTQLAAPRVEVAWGMAAGGFVLGWLVGRRTR